jgi:UDP-N-acetylglucosamine/UDP-N-acetylgalactosamine diphosphorylase
MTSDATDRPTKDYFEQHARFGLPREDVRFFQQRMMPALDRNFRLVLVAKDRILLSPNGHGGTLLALAESGMADDMERRGIEEISYFQVDNCLVPAADPVFLGCHSLAGAEMSSKALSKREPEEPIGAFVRVNGVLVVREYSDLTREQMRERTAGGQFLYGLGSIAIHALRVDFVRRETRAGFKLPFHLAEKSSPFLDESGALVQPKDKNVYKFETFIFDALRDARRTVVLEVRREEEFSPLKNATGKDSPETCRRDLSALGASWLDQAGARVPRDEQGAPKYPIEISPLLALDAAELAGKIPQDLNLAGPVLLAPPG